MKAPISTAISQSKKRSAFANPLRQPDIRLALPFPMRGAMTRPSILNWALYIGLMAAIMLWLAWGKPLNIAGMFITAGLAVGSLYALGGIGMVVLFRASGVLNFSSGAAGAAGAMVSWQCVLVSSPSYGLTIRDLWSFPPTLSALNCLASRSRAQG
jgi:hypothetical protein